MRRDSKASSPISSSASGSTSADSSFTTRPTGHLLHIHPHHAPLLFSAFLSAIMVCIVSGFVLVMSQGLHSGLGSAWLRSVITTWPVAFPTVAVVAPQVRRLVTHLTT